MRYRMLKWQSLTDTGNHGNKVKQILPTNTSVSNKGGEVWIPHVRRGLALGKPLPAMFIKKQLIGIRQKFSHFKLIELMGFSQTIIKY